MVRFGASSALVLYGANGALAARSDGNPALCNNGVFECPAPKVSKLVSSGPQTCGSPLVLCTGVVHCTSMLRCVRRPGARLRGACSVSPDLPPTGSGRRCGSLSEKEEQSDEPGRSFCELRLVMLRSQHDEGQYWYLKTP